MTQITKTLKILKRKEIKAILSKLHEQWGFDKELDYIFLEGKEGKIFIVNREISNIDLGKLRINSAGLYIAKVINDRVRMSIEGSQLIGPFASKNVLEISDKLARLWMKGYDIPFDEEKGKSLNGFQIIKNNNDYLGSGIFKENRILNFVPKARRLVVSD